MKVSLLYLVVCVGLTLNLYAEPLVFSTVSCTKAVECSEKMLKMHRMQNAGDIVKLMVESAMMSDKAKQTRDDYTSSVSSLHMIYSLFNTKSIGLISMPGGIVQITSGNEAIKGALFLMTQKNKIAEAYTRGGSSEAEDRAILNAYKKSSSYLEMVALSKDRQKLKEAILAYLAQDADAFTSQF